MTSLNLAVNGEACALVRGRRAQRRQRSSFPTLPLPSLAIFLNIADNTCNFSSKFTAKTITVRWWPTL